MKDQSQPPPRAECDACGSQPARSRYSGSGGELRDALCSDGADVYLCDVHTEYACDGRVSGVIEMVRARRRSLQSAQKFYGTQPSVLPETLPDIDLLGVDDASLNFRNATLRRDGDEECTDYYLAEGPRISWNARRVPWHLVPIQPTPPAKHEWQPGMRVTWDERENPCGAKFGVVDPVGSINRLYASIYGDGAYVSLDKPNADNIREWWVPLNILRPAASAQPDPFSQTVKCDECGTELDAMTACKRTRVVNGRNEYVPGTFCAECPEKPTPQPRRDPSVCQCGQTAWRDDKDFDGSPICGDCSSMVADLCLEQVEAPRGDELRVAHARHFRAERLRAQHLADLDRPIRTGPLLNRCRYGSLLSNHGWDSSDVDDELGCS